MFTIGASSLPKPDPERISAIKRWVCSHLKLDDSTAVFVTQLECKESGCPPVETVIAIMKGGEEPMKRKIHKSINEIFEADLLELFSQEDKHLH